MRRDGFPGGRNAHWSITAFGETKTVAKWVQDTRCSDSPDALRARVRAGVPPEKAITLPPNADLPKDGRRIRKRSGPRRLLDWERIVALHTRDGLAPAEIAAAVGANESTIRHGLKARGQWQKPAPLAHGRELRKIWEAVRSRCENEDDPSYRYYGARGKRLCAAWREFRSFHRWGVESGYEVGQCLALSKRARVYSPRNCSWTTPLETTLQAYHPDSKMPPRWTVEAFGETKGPTEWSRDRRCLVSASGLIRRLRAGWPPEEAISAPPQTPGKSGEMVRPVTAFGSTKSVADWSRDPRCSVTTTTIEARLDRGIDPEQAIATPPYRLASAATRSRARRPGC